MSRKVKPEKQAADYAPIFAALGDETRLSLVLKLADRHSWSITQLSQGGTLSRQAITKHLRVLESVGLVRAQRAGRECLYELSPGPFRDIEDYLDFVSRQWDDALLRLKDFVEE